MVLARGRRDGVGSIWAGLRDQHVVHDGPLSDDRHRDDHARRRRLRDERAGPRRGRLPDAVAHARARPRRTMMAAATMAAPRAGLSPSGTTRGAIVIDDVVKIYDPDGAAVMAVDHCSLDIDAGEICMIVGPSGCGKTTLLNAIAGFHEITSGRILLDGEVLCSAEKPKAEPTSDRIVVFQNGALFPWKTNLENVAFGPLMQGKLSKDDAFEKARAMMADAGLAGVEHNYPGEVSSGMRRRVEIVRALMNEPKVLLLDEPYRALDSLTKSVMHEALLEIYYRNKVTIF